MVPMAVPRIDISIIGEQWIVAIEVYFVKCKTFAAQEKAFVSNVGVEHKEMFYQF